MEIYTLGSKIKKRRKQLGLTLRDLAGSRITPAQLSYVETDKCKPSLDLLEYISDRLGLEMDYLLESEKKQAARYCQHSIILSRVGMAKGCCKEAECRLSEAVQISDRYGLDCLSGDAELQLGDICESRNDYHDQIGHYLKALESFSRADNVKGIVMSYINMGRAAYNKGKRSLSLDYFKQAERFTGSMDDYDLFTKIKLFNYLMLVSVSLGNNKDSMYYADTLSGYLELINDIRGYFTILAEESQSAVSDQSHDEIIDKYGKALDIMSYMDNAKLVSAIRSNIDIIYASIHGKASTESINNMLGMEGISKGSASALDLISSACGFLACKKYDKALDAAKGLLNICIYERDISYEPTAYGIMFRAYFQKGDFIRAEECIRECAAAFERTDTTGHLFDCFNLMGNFYMHINRDKEAVNCILKAIDEYEKNRCQASETWYQDGGRYHYD